MKICRLQTLARRIISRSIIISHDRNASSILSFSTTPERRYKTQGTFRLPGDFQLNDLFKRISKVGDYRVSIRPILDRYIEDGGSVNKNDLVFLIRKLRYHRRFTHALEVSKWMTEKRHFGLTSVDYCIRLDLIAKVNGVEAAEDFFNYIPEKLRGLGVYGALLNCYVYTKSVEKAEEVMQKLRVLDNTRNPLSYNLMLNIYYKTGETEKFGNILSEMEEKDIRYDSHTYGIIVSAHTAASDGEGLEKTVEKIVSDPDVVSDWVLHVTVANGYTKLGFPDKALEMLRKAEGLVTTKKRSIAYNYLLTQYCAVGKKDEVLRLWEIYKSKEKILNRGYIAMISSMLKLDDLETALTIFDEWESKAENYDISIPNILAGGYCRKGLLDEAEKLIDRAISKGGKPNVWTWNNMLVGCLHNNQIPKAVEMMKKAIAVSHSSWKPPSEELAVCLKFLREENIEEAENLIKLLKDKDYISLEGQQRLLNHLKPESPDQVEISLV